MRAASPTAISGVTLPLVHTSSTRRSSPGSCFDGSTWKFTRWTGEKFESMRMALIGRASGSRRSAAW